MCLHGLGDMVVDIKIKSCFFQLVKPLLKLLSMFLCKQVGLTFFLLWPPRFSHHFQSSQARLYISSLQWLRFPKPFQKLQRTD